MSRLGLTVPQGATEPLVSFASRLAAAQADNHRLQVFLGDMGLTLSQVAVGQERAIRKLAELGGADLEELQRYTPQRLGAGRTVLAGEVLSPERFAPQRLRAGQIVLAGEVLPPTACVRSEVRVCPACLRADAAKGGLSPALAMHGRAAWLVRFLRTCPTHDLPLVRLATDNANVSAPDFAHVVKQHLSAIQDPLKDPPPRPATSLDHFVAEIASVNEV